MDAGATVRRMLLAAGLSGVALLGTWGSTQWAPTWADKLAEAEHQQGGDPATVRPPAKEWTLIWLSVGAIVGTLVAALAGDWLGRRKSYCVMCAASLASVWLLYRPWNPAVRFDNTLLGYAFLAGACTASFYGWLPLYLPELFRTAVRATGQGFGFNFGRILAAVGALQVGNLLSLFADGANVAGVQLVRGYPLACATMSLIYVAGLFLIWLAPETKGRPLPE